MIMKIAGKMTAPIHRRGALPVALACLMFLVAAPLVAKEALTDMSGLGGSNRVYAQWAWENADVHSIFEHLAKISGVDIVVDPRVDGFLTLKVTNKTWQDVFNIVCRMNKLAAVRGDKYLYVMTEKDYQAERLQRAENAYALANLADLKREVVRLSYVNAEDMAATVQELKSDRGNITPVKHTNSLIIFDTEENVGQIRSLIEKLDIETPQISIAAKIIEVNTNVLQKLGVQWGAFGTAQNHEVSASHTPGGAAEDAIGRLSFGILSSDRFAAALEYLFRDNNGKVVAQPSITTMDNLEATVFMGEQIQNIVRDEADNSITTTYTPVGTRLVVTPHVTEEKRVTMDLYAEKSSVSSGSQNPRTQSAQTNVSVNDGETVVIAGLTSNTETEGEEGVPLLKDIPILGHLFKHSNKTVSNADLLIFVTPRIIGKDMNPEVGFEIDEEQM
jgi:type II secretory pathway component GspD/PulD (secretin)